MSIRKKCSCDNVFVVENEEYDYDICHSCRNRIRDLAQDFKNKLDSIDENIEEGTKIYYEMQDYINTFEEDEQDYLIRYLNGEV